MYAYKYSVDIFIVYDKVLGIGGVLVVCGECYYLAVN